ncbi:MAG: hypothetical protein ACOX9E_15375 [Lentisphaeria bacterium]|jgi:hypothetical protein
MSEALLSIGDRLPGDEGLNGQGGEKSVLLGYVSCSFPESRPPAALAALQKASLSKRSTMAPGLAEVFPG